MGNSGRVEMATYKITILIRCYHLVIETAEGLARRSQRRDAPILHEHSSRSDPVLDLESPHTPEFLRIVRHQDAVKT